jgi:uncharacterized protein (TIGR04255 family)
MPFPETQQKIIYRKNPLDRVICQLRFPPILKIDTELPVGFQERIRNDFPEFREKEEAILPLPQIEQREIIPWDTLRNIMPTKIKNYEFTSEDGLWRINLTRTFVALTSLKYERRSQFKQKLENPMKALIDIYQPAYFSRIGLRYVDIIKRSLLNMREVNWNELLKPYILGLLGSNEVWSDIKSFEAKYDIQLESDGGTARVITKLVDWEEKNEPCFMIDTDFFTTERTEIENAENKLEFFHIRASRLIRWLITDRLHTAMEPEVVT